MPTHHLYSFAAVVGLVTLLWAPAAAQVSGVVVDDASGQPIGGARVTLQATETWTEADALGAFTLPELAGLGLVVVGAAPGYFNGGVVVDAPAAGITLRLEAVPDTDNQDYALLEPEFCGLCHDDQLASWRGSPMAKAGDNTWVYDLYDGSGTPGGMGGFVYTRDSRLAEAAPESECRACHQPDRWIEDPFSALDAAAGSHGVTCEVCHQIAEIDETRPNYPGIYPGVVRLSRPASGRATGVVRYGLLGDVDYVGTGMRAAYQPQLEAAVCAACHQDANDPDLDGDFEEPGSIISEPTYLEWRDSPYGDPSSPHYASCVDCHMPPSDAEAACRWLLLGRPEGQVRSHEIRGTSAEYLENALRLDLDAALAAGEVTVRVDVVNDRTGHHVPTGVTVRNVLLLVEAFDADSGAALELAGGDRLPELAGVGAPAAGYFAGLPGRMYAVVNHDAHGSGPTFFTDAAGVTSDTRIAALATDTSDYRFTRPAGVDAVRISARVIYRRAWRALVDAKGWTEDGHGRPLEDLAPPHFGHLMASAERHLSEGAAPDGPPDGDGDVGDGGDAAPDAGAAEAHGGAGSAGDGCGCQSAASAVLPTWLGLALWLWAARARRARTSPGRRS